MSDKSSINQLLKNPALWQAARVETHRPSHPTGFEKLDVQLCDGGWPQGAVTELLLPTDGTGELRLLLPALSKLSRQQGYIVFVDPPFLPYAPALNKQGLNLNKLLVIRSKKLEQSIWATYQALTSQSCSAVVTWLTGKAAYKNEIRKLSLGARQGRCWSFVLRDEKAAVHPSAAKLRVALSMAKQHKAISSNANYGMSQLSILKQPGGWSNRKVYLNLFPEQRFWTSVSAKHWSVPVVKQAPQTVLSPELAAAIPYSVEQWLKQVTPGNKHSLPLVH
ncbi:MAG: translesion DNA synthesis-associated protein ImuA [Gammaproteobacteria bacterium]|nr:translesion DNA synthesis-associated protein ImuA [Gammaproteobacteria bacterium]